MRNTHDVSSYYIIIIMTSINRGAYKTQYRHRGPHNTTICGVIIIISYYIVYGVYTSHHT